MYTIDMRTITVENFYEALHRLYNHSERLVNGVLDEFGLPNYYDFLAEYDIEWVGDYLDYKKLCIMMNRMSNPDMRVFFEDNNPIFCFCEDKDDVVVWGG